MIKYKCYKADELIKLLGNDFHIINEKVQDTFSDWTTTTTNTEHVNKFYITNRSDIKEVTEWHCLWTEIIIKLTDNTKLKLHSHNINSDNGNLLRITENNFFSPPFERQEHYILANKDLAEWLIFNGISQNSLDDITITFELYPTYTFEGIHEPVIKNGKICGYYYKCMKITEDKIDRALSDIKDVEMRLRFEKIIKSFNKIYE